MKIIAESFIGQENLVAEPSVAKGWQGVVNINHHKNLWEVTARRGIMEKWTDAASPSRRIEGKEVSGGRQKRVTFTIGEIMPTTTRLQSKVGRASIVPEERDDDISTTALPEQENRGVNGVNGAGLGHRGYVTEYSSESDDSSCEDESDDDWLNLEVHPRSKTGRRISSYAEEPEKVPEVEDEDESCVSDPSLISSATKFVELFKSLSVLEKKQHEHDKLVHKIQKLEEDNAKLVKAKQKAKQDATASKRKVAVAEEKARLAEKNTLRLLKENKYLHEENIYLHHLCKCPVCDVVKQEMFVGLTCGHRICFDCYEQVGNKCPTCRSVWKKETKTMKRLY